MRATRVALASSLALLVTACSDAGGPTESAPTPDPGVPTSDSGVPTSEPSAPTSDSGVSANATASVPIYPGESIQAAVDRSPAGTTFLIKAGVHRRQSVAPKSGNVFVGEAGAILDGENATKYAFWRGRTPYPANVRIRGVIIERYVAGSQQAAIHVPGTTGWVVEDSEIRYNSEGGIRYGHKMRVLRNKIHHNARLGMGGSGDSILIEGNEIYYNNYQKQYPFGFELGGAKFGSTRWLVVRDNWVHHNEGNGLWNDVNSIYTLVENNRVQDNSGVGIFYEISREAVIRGNVVERNGFARGWYYGAGILIAHSPNVEVYGNTVSGNKEGIAGIQQNRTNKPSPYGPHRLENLYVHDNTITITSGRTGVAQDIGDNAVFTSRNNRFAYNTYNLGTNAQPFEWLNAGRTKAQWRAYGQDVNGTFNP